MKASGRQTKIEIFYDPMDDDDDNDDDDHDGLFDNIQTKAFMIRESEARLGKNRFTRATCLLGENMCLSRNDSLCSDEIAEYNDKGYMVQLQCKHIVTGVDANSIKRAQHAISFLT